MTQRKDKKALESRMNELVNEIGQLEKELKQREEQLPAILSAPIRSWPLKNWRRKLNRKKSSFGPSKINSLSLSIPEFLEKSGIR